MLKVAVKGAPKVHHWAGFVTEVGRAEEKYSEGTLGKQAPTSFKPMSGMLSVEPSESVNESEVLQLEFQRPWILAAALEQGAQYRRREYIMPRMGVLPVIKLPKLTDLICHQNDRNRSSICFHGASPGVHNRCYVGAKYKRCPRSRDDADTGKVDHPECIG